MSIKTGTLVYQSHVERTKGSVLMNAIHGTVSGDPAEGLIVSSSLGTGVAADVVCSADVGAVNVEAWNEVTGTLTATLSDSVSFNLGLPTITDVFAYQASGAVNVAQTPISPTSFSGETLSFAEAVSVGCTFGYIITQRKLDYGSPESNILYAFSLGSNSCSAAGSRTVGTCPTPTWVDWGNINSNVSMGMYSGDSIVIQKFAPDFTSTPSPTGAITTNTVQDDIGSYLGSTLTASYGYDWPSTTTDWQTVMTPDVHEGGIIHAMSKCGSSYSFQEVAYQKKLSTVLFSNIGSISAGNLMQFQNSSGAIQVSPASSFVGIQQVRIRFDRFKAVFA